MMFDVYGEDAAICVQYLANKSLCVSVCLFLSPLLSLGQSNVYVAVAATGISTDDNGIDARPLGCSYVDHEVRGQVWSTVAAIAADDAAAAAAADAVVSTAAARRR